MKTLTGTTPKKITTDVMKFSAMVVPNGQLKYVLVITEPYAVLNRCFQNVEAKIDFDGGRIVYGWTIWLTKGVLIEAEFHAVWESPEGELIDISPKVDGEKKILFLPDPVKKWEGSLVPNITKRLRSNLYF